MTFERIQIEFITECADFLAGARFFYVFYKLLHHEIDAGNVQNPPEMNMTVGVSRVRAQTKPTPTLF